MPRCGCPGAITVLLFVLRFHPSAALAASIHVPAEIATIQSAIDSAADGDSILVSAGTYHERLRIFGKNLSLIGTGEDLTFLSGGGMPPDSMAILTLRGVDSRTRITGFTFEDNVNTMVPGPYREVTAGAIFCDGKPWIEGNTFRNNEGVCGGAINVNLECDSCPGGVVIRSNRFLNNKALQGGGGIFLWFSDGAVIEENVFEGNVALGGGGIYSEFHYGPIDVRSNVFFRNSAGYGGAVSFEGPFTDGLSRVVGNTFAFNETVCTCRPHPGGTIRIYGGTGDSLIATNNIIAYSVNSYGLEVVGAPSVAPTAALDCNDFWANEAGNVFTYAATVTFGTDDFFADPLFCNPTAGILTLGAGSPCLAGNNANCGSVGALASGCLDVVGVPETSEPSGPALKLAIKRRGREVEFLVTATSATAVGTGTLEIFDIQGRLLLAPDVQISNGRAEYRWRGVTQTGEPVVSGMYFARVRFASTSATQVFAYLK